MDGNTRILIALLAVIAVCAGGYAALMMTDGEDAPMVTIPTETVDFRTVSTRYDDGFRVEYIPNSPDPALYAVTYEILRGTMPESVEDMETVDSGSDVPFENVSEVHPITFHVTGAWDSGYAISVEIRDADGVLVHESTLSATPATYDPWSRIQDAGDAIDALEAEGYDVTEARRILDEIARVQQRQSEALEQRDDGAIRETQHELNALWREFILETRSMAPDFSV
ncbi:MAG: hypothetical protein KO206_06975 [Methanomicrobiaceae archaeon]|uniref:Uncharacterized protein n=1 Tax=hydrocarbon metagenome TaxID=938273 RepID=A0A0W8FEH0_9ZZZZ|nr:hypothetical protein [Methanomicrobiaceae archaeon]MDD5418518.1 hypothetical protein [Methanomicrobiaceae archaeon]